MTRKSKRAGGNFPLTHYERTKKFASSQYGTVTARLAGHAQYQLGDCALSLARLGEEALCTPSGYLYERDAILEYLLTKTQEIKQQQEAVDKQQAAKSTSTDDEEDRRRKQFEEAQSLIRSTTSIDPHQQAKASLKHVSYWLADSQPDAVERVIDRPPERPQSPHSQTPLRRKDLWPVHLQWQEDKLVCAVSSKPLRANAVTAYWTDKTEPGTLVLTSVFDDMVGKTCPLTTRKVKYTRTLQQSGTSYAGSTQQVEVKKYVPTIT